MLVTSLEFRDKLMLTILSGLMLRHKEHGYSDAYAIDEAFRLAQVYCETPAPQTSEEIERNDSGGVAGGQGTANTSKPKIRPTVLRCLKPGDCVDPGNADCRGCDYFSV